MSLLLFLAEEKIAPDFELANLVPGCGENAFVVTLVIMMDFYRIIHVS